MELVESMQQDYSMQQYFSMQQQNMQQTMKMEQYHNNLMDQKTSFNAVEVVGTDSNGFVLALNYSGAPIIVNGINIHDQVDQTDRHPNFLNDNYCLGSLYCSVLVSDINQLDQSASQSAESLGPIRFKQSQKIFDRILIESDPYASY